jgi:serine/threonine protein phosphatase PrpC
LAKKMRLAAAQLTDVGRKRDRNQDNVTHFIPTDTNVLDEKGALFVVCDGMGGHAAGEVAAEMGVNTIRETYYASRTPDTINALAAAIETANDAIYNHAREHPELTGMGTTCVTAAVVDGRAFVVNIGDSRAYLVRDGQMRQITRDHSWVAEQVRVGLLTEEQARSHSHRNVITRSLGTQPNVTADLFVETLQNGDRLLLCSDGLHGYVEGDEIEREMVEHKDPDRAAQRLVDMANENGGPDNITALIVHLIDVPAPSKDLALPAGDLSVQGTTQPMPAAAAQKAASDKLAKPAMGARASGPASRPRQTARARRTNGLIVAIRLLVALLIVAIGASIWYIELGPYAAQQAANQRLSADVAAAQQAVDQSQGQDPAQALKQLAATRQQVLDDLSDQNVDPQNRAQATTVLSERLEPAVQQAIARYNTAALITPVGDSGAQNATVQCSAPPAATSVPLQNTGTLMPVTWPAGKPGTHPPAVQVLYGLNSGKVYQIRMPTDSAGAPSLSGISCAQMALPTVATVVAIAGDGPTLYALAEQSNAQYVVLTITLQGLGRDGTPSTSVATSFGVPTRGGETPQLVAARNGTVYVSYAGNTMGNPGVWLFTGKEPKAPSRTVLLAQTAQALLATNNTLYMLLADGSLGQLDTAQQYLPLSVSVPSPLTSTSPNSYAIATPVPTPANTPTLPPTSSPADAGATPAASVTVGGAPSPTPLPSPTGTLFRHGQLVADPQQPTHVLLGDGANDRIVRLIASTSGPGLGLGAQYVYGKQLHGALALAVTADSAQLHAFTWSQGRLVTYALPQAVAAGA